MKEPILYVDDELQNLTGFKYSFFNEFTVYTATNAREAMDILAKYEIKVVISDQRMSEMSGIEFLTVVSQRYPDAIRIILTAYSDVDDAINAINQVGIYRYLTKPFKTDELRTIIMQALQTYNLVKQNAQLVNDLQLVNEGLVRSNQRLRWEMEQRELAQKALLDSEKQFRSLAENIHDIVIRVSVSSEIIFLNTKAQEVFKIPANEKATLDNWNLNFEECNFLKSKFYEIFSNKTVEHFQLNCPLSKPTRVIDWMLVPEYDDAGVLISVLGLGRDITTLKNTEVELIKARQHAEESDKLKSAFLANMSHEIRTPMNGIIGFLEIIATEELTPDEKDYYIDIINKSSNQLLSLINDIIDLSKIEAGMVEVHLTDTKINELLNELYAFFLPQAQHRNIAFRTDYALASDLAVIKTDTIKITQVITNLLSNAMKFTKNGEVRLGYACEDGFLKFFVSDTGIGIPSDKQSVIFERFRQADNSHTRLFGGTGLGLAISKAYIEMLGGIIGLESVENKGTTFFFTLPYCPVSYTATIDDITLQNYITESWQGKTILVAEDEDLNFLFLNRVLEKKNVTVLRARSGAEAVTIVRERDVDILLMDIKMPEMDGYEATAEIRKTHPHLPIIAQTAYAMTEDKIRVLESGFSEYISKPIKKDKLLEVLGQFLLTAR